MPRSVKMVAKAAAQSETAFTMANTKVAQVGWSELTNHSARTNWKPFGCINRCDAAATECNGGQAVVGVWWKVCFILLVPAA